MHARPCVSRSCSLFDFLSHGHICEVPGRPDNVTNVVAFSRSGPLVHTVDTASACAVLFAQFRYCIGVYAVSVLVNVEHLGSFC